MLARTFPMVIMVLFKKKNFTIDIVWILAERFSCFNELQKGGSENCDQEMLVWGEPSMVVHYHSMVLYISSLYVTPVILVIM